MWNLIWIRKHLVRGIFLIINIAKATQAKFEKGKSIYSFIIHTAMNTGFPERAQNLTVGSTLTAKQNHSPFSLPEPLSNVMLEESSPLCVHFCWCFSHGYFFGIDLTYSWQKSMATSVPCGWVTNLWWCCMDSTLWRTALPPAQRMFPGDYRPMSSTEWQMESVRCSYLWKDFILDFVSFRVFFTDKPLVPNSPILSAQGEWYNSAALLYVVYKVLLSHMCFRISSEQQYLYLAKSCLSICSVV